MTQMCPLISSAGELTFLGLKEAPNFSRPVTPLRSRTAFAAAHVVPRVTAENIPNAPADIDWDATLGFRRHLYSWGLGVADAMDTAQRNQGLDDGAIKELIVRSAEVARDSGGALVVGVNTDQLNDESVPLSKAIDAYKEQLHFAEEHGTTAVIMASRHIARAADGAEDYARAYRDVLQSASQPAMLHWLGEEFDPSLTGYFGSGDWKVAAQTVLSIIEDNLDSVSGVKMSLLNPIAEVYVRERLPKGVQMYTGDDFNYVELIGGTDLASRTRTEIDGSSESRHSDALLGAFAAIAPAASVAIQALDEGDPQRYLAVLGPTEILSRHIFSHPTYFYKTGVAFLAWLNGHQPSFQMVSGHHSSRSLPHLSKILELADGANVLENPTLASARWEALLRVNGVEL